MGDWVCNATGSDRGEGAPRICGRPPPASPRFAVREARVPHSSARCTGRPPPAHHHAVGGACAWRAPPPPHIHKNAKKKPSKGMKVEEIGGEWRKKWGGGWGNSGHSTWDVGCGGLWRDVVEENGMKMGGKWDEIPIFHRSVLPILPEAEDLPHPSLCENQVTALTNGKMVFFATHRHPPPAAGVGGRRVPNWCPDPLPRSAHKKAVQRRQGGIRSTIRL